MRLRVASFVFTLILGLAIAGPVTKITEKKSLVENTKLQKEEPKIEDIGDEKERSKKSTTSFCVEIRPGTNEAVQTPCTCKDKEIPHGASPNVNIINAPPQQPQTLNIIQPAPTLHAVHFAQPQPSFPNVQNVHVIQPVAQLPEPRPQIHVLPSSSKTSVEIHSSEPSKEEQVKPSEPAPKPAAEQEHTERSHKNEVHVSVVTEDKQKEQESEPHPVKIVEKIQKPDEIIKIVQVAPIRQPCQEHFVVVPSGSFVQAPQMTLGTIYQSPFYQVSSSIYQQGRSASPDIQSMITPSEMTVQGRTSRIMPMTIVPYPVQSEKSAVTVHCSPEESSASVPSFSHDSPTIVNMQTVRSKDGIQQGEAIDMLQPITMGERTVSHLSLDTHPSPFYGHLPHTSKIVYDMVPGLHSNLHREPFVKHLYGHPHHYVNLGRNAESTNTDLKQDELKDTKMVSQTPELTQLARIVRSEKDETAKVEEKTTQEKKIEEKTSSTKAA